MHIQSGRVIGFLDVDGGDGWSGGETVVHGEDVGKRICDLLGLTERMGRGVI